LKWSWIETSRSNESARSRNPTPMNALRPVRPPTLSHVNCQTTNTVTHSELSDHPHQWHQSVSNIVRVQSPPFPFPLLSSPPFLLPSFYPSIRSRPQQFRCILRVKECCWWHSRCTVSNNIKLIFLTFLKRNLPRANFQISHIAFIL